MSKPRILYVIADSSQTGAPRQVFYLMRGLSHDFELHVACPPGWLEQEAKKLGAQVHLFRDNHSRRMMITFLQHLYSTLKPAIIHCHGVRGGMVARMAASMDEVLVYTEHRWTSDFHLPNRLREWVQLAGMRLIRPKTRYTVAVSKAVQEFMIDRKLADPNRIRVIYNAIEPIAEGTSVPEPILGTLGHLTWVKGVEYLIRALSSIIKQFGAVRLMVAGDGPDRPSLERLAHELKVHDHVIWLGQVSKPEQFYPTLQVYVHPAITESFGLAPLEAMSAGIPTVATNGGALPELIEDGKDGLLCPPRDAEALAKAVCSLLQDSKLRAKLGSAGRAKALQFSIARMIDEHQKLYRELL